MKSIFTIALTFALLNTSFLIAQDTLSVNTEDTSKFNLYLTTGIGYGKVENEEQPNYDLNANIGEIILNYNFAKDIGVGLGIGYVQLSGNGFNQNGNFYHERDLLKIPLVLTTKSKLSDKVNFYAHIGGFGQVILNEEYRYLNTTEEDVYKGWSFGIQGYLGFTYKMSKMMDIGINISTQSDLGKSETESAASLKDEQKVTTLNTIGLAFMFRL